MPAAATKAAAPETMPAGRLESGTTSAGKPRSVKFTVPSPAG